MSSDTTTRNRLQAFRIRRDDFFKSEEDSPLAPDQKERFTTLDYFPENPALSLELPLDTSGEGIGEVLTIGTTDGQAKQFERAGRITFEANGEPVTFTVFKEQARGRYYLPFRDGTAGVDTYAVWALPRHPGSPQRAPPGRLQLRLQPVLRLRRWLELPDPAPGNVTKTRIEAGERAFTDRADYEL